MTDELQQRADEIYAADRASDPDEPTDDDLALDAEDEAWMIANYGDPPPRHTMTCQTCKTATATCAVRMQRPTRDNLWTKVWWTESEAPRAAERLCGSCAVALLGELAKVLA